ncbi:MAG: tRNA pseudouridine synthase A [Trueperella sp.]|nr:tRNA pseudouridine synthase A [Trueperella sp.]
MTIRIRLDISYDGARFHGWAAQPGLRTVQGVLETALATVLREPVALTVAGRTDAGVHARGQVAHGDISAAAWAALPGRSDIEPGYALAGRLNAVLARELNTGDQQRGYTPVVVRRVQQVPQDFDARFSALWRAYTYRIAAGVAAWDPLRHDTLWLPEMLDVAAMNRAAQPLLGEHDFLSFCKPRPGASTVRTLLQCEFVPATQPGVAPGDATGAVPEGKTSGAVIVGQVCADAFCHSQVRTLMGTLIAVGRGARSEDWPRQRLLERSRDGQVIVAPPHPLTLVAVGYPDDPADYAAQSQAARRFRG